MKTENVKRISKTSWTDPSAPKPPVLMNVVGSGITVYLFFKYICSSSWEHLGWMTTDCYCINHTLSHTWKVLACSVCSVRLLPTKMVQIIFLLRVPQSSVICAIPSVGYDKENASGTYSYCKITRIRTSGGFLFGIKTATEWHSTNHNTYYPVTCFVSALVPPHTPLKWQPKTQTLHTKYLVFLGGPAAGLLGDSNLNWQGRGMATLHQNNGPSWRGTYRELLHNNDLIFRTTRNQRHTAPHWIQKILCYGTFKQCISPTSTPWGGGLHIVRVLHLKSEKWLNYSNTKSMAPQHYTRRFSKHTDTIPRMQNPRGQRNWIRTSLSYNCR